MSRRVDVLFAVRDSGAIRRLAREMDDGQNCLFTIVYDGKRALEAVRHRLPDILVVDAVLPGMDGLGLADRVLERYGERAPLVIGGSMMHFADDGFARRGTCAELDVPWEEGPLRTALLEAMDMLRSRIDWDALPIEQAKRMLAQAGLREHLHGFDYLALCGALACEDESRIRDIGREIYMPAAQRLGTTPQNVERLIRHAVESAMDNGAAGGIYRFFGNTIDPTRGKPTNAQMIAMLGQRLRMLPHGRRDNEQMH